jgi:tetratricopeptide (TPR) repeat protein
VLLQAQGRLAEAERYGREVLETSRRVLGDEHPNVLIYLNNMGVLLRVQGKFTEAEPYCREALAKFRRAQGDDHPDTLTLINNLGMLLHLQGKLDEAEPYCREALERRRRVRGDEHADTLVSIVNMAGLLLALGKPADAVELLVPAESAARREFTGGNAVKLGRFITTFGRARAAVSDFESAETRLNEAREILGEATGVLARDRTEVLNGLIELHDAWHAAEPDRSYDVKAAEWRAELAEWQASSQPALP